MHHRKYGAKDPKRRAVGWAVVILVHALVLWALITGTARDALKIMKKPMEAAVIQEVIIPPPPPPPPPPKEIVKPITPKVEAPPPPFVPPPEVTPPSTAPAITSVQTPPPAPPVIAPPPPPAAPVGRQEMGVACPNQVKPEMPRQAIKEGIEGLVKAQATIRGGKVVEVAVLAGPRVYHNAVRNAMMQYGCVSGSGDIIATQEFNFRIE
ncbi:energy transducer TonB [Ramlibacter tataouinensis]|uniref:Energy transducer TonB n=1 Tax=Ramlibacter tataouinensis TaxID=94132 RepID=A0A127JZV6_9BURK|nr:energy transducer TonB [Ramlibacter tataouinensis]